MVGGYELDYLKSLMPNHHWPVSVLCKPSEIKQALTKLILDNNYRETVGKNAKEFVSQNWSAEKVASNYKLLIDDNIPDDWWFDPNEVLYIAGLGNNRRDYICCQSFANGIWRKFSLPATSP